MPAGSHGVVASGGTSPWRWCGARRRPPARRPTGQHLAVAVADRPARRGQLDGGQPLLDGLGGVRLGLEALQPHQPARPMRDSITSTASRLPRSRRVGRPRVTAGGVGRPGAGRRGGRGRPDRAAGPDGRGRGRRAAGRRRRRAAVDPAVGPGARTRRCRTRRSGLGAVGSAARPRVRLGRRPRRRPAAHRPPRPPGRAAAAAGSVAPSTAPSDSRRKAGGTRPAPSPSRWPSRRASPGARSASTSRIERLLGVGQLDRLTRSSCRWKESLPEHGVEEQQPEQAGDQQGHHATAKGPAVSRGDGPHRDDR
jgi:hypothetical protein